MGTRTNSTSPTASISSGVSTGTSSGKSSSVCLVVLMLTYTLYRRPGINVQQQAQLRSLALPLRQWPLDGCRTYHHIHLRSCLDVGRCSYIVKVWNSSKLQRPLGSLEGLQNSPLSILSTASKPPKPTVPCSSNVYHSPLYRRGNPWQIGRAHV